MGSDRVPTRSDVFKAPAQRLGDDGRTLAVCLESVYFLCFSVWMEMSLHIPHEKLVFEVTTFGFGKNT